MEGCEPGGTPQTPSRLPGAEVVLLFQHQSAPFKPACRHQQKVLSSVSELLHGFPLTDQSRPAAPAAQVRLDWPRTIHVSPVVEGEPKLFV